MDLVHSCDALSPTTIAGGQGHAELRIVGVVEGGVIDTSTS